MIGNQIKMIGDQTEVISTIVSQAEEVVNLTKIFSSETVVLVVRLRCLIGIQSVPLTIIFWKLTLQ